MFASILTMIGGIISASTTERDSYEASAFLNGLACGMSLLITISESMSDSAHRGRVSSLDSIGLTSGMFLYSVLTFIYFNVASSMNFKLSQQLGLVTCVLSLLAFGYAFKAIDSPISYLIVSDESGAFQSVMDLNGEKCASSHTYNHFEELKNFVLDDRKVSCLRRIRQGFLPFLEIAVVRTFFTLSATFPIFFAAWTTSQLELSAYAIIIYGTVRMFGASISQSVLLDKLGRKPVLLLATFVSGGLLCATAYFMEFSVLNYRLTLILWMLVGTQFFAGLGQGVSSVYMTEAFAPHVKHFFVLLILILENVAVVLAFHYTRFSNNAEFCYTIGGGFIVSFIFTLIVLPETKKLSLKDAKAKF